MIVDYSYYTDTYLGNKISNKDDFNRVEIKASSQILKLIMNRDYSNWNGKDYTEQVKMATCSIIDILYDLEETENAMKKKQSGKTISSEKVGDYSRNFENASYKELQEQSSNIDSKIEKEASNFLWYTGLMNRSVTYVR